MNTACIEMPSIFFGSPGDWKKWWLAEWADFLEILHVACDPDGMEKYIERRIELLRRARTRRNLRRLTRISEKLPGGYR